MGGDSSAITNQITNTSPGIRSESYISDASDETQIYELQSDVEQIPDITETGVLTISNAVTSTEHDVPMVTKDLFSLRQDASRSMAQFFSRPVRMATLNLAGLTETFFEPLHYFFNFYPQNRDRIRGFTYLHGTLHIKIAINSPARCSGAALVALQPWHTRDNGLGPLSGSTTPTLDFTQLSSLPHVFADYSNEAGGEISMPIIAPTNGLDVTYQEQLKSAFRLIVSPLFPAQIDAGDSQAKPTMTILVWLTDVSLTVPTTRLELQSDEYTIHPKDQPSSIKVALKNTMHKILDNVTGFATDAAMMAAYAAAGLSKPINPDPHVQHVYRSVGPLSNFNGMESIPRLSADIKQEVYMDSKHLGFDGADDMDILNIAQRPAIVSTFGFATNGSPLVADTVMRISPTMSNTYPVPTTGDAAFTPCPMAFVALPFSKWRGTIKIRFKVVCSAFARGKIKIAHEPNYSTGVADNDFNNLNTVIWDISQNKELIVHVPWTSNLPFKRIPLLHGALGTTDVLGSNGALLITTVTPIIDPGMTAIYVAAYASAGDDMVFADMRPNLANYTFAGIDATYVGTPPSFARVGEKENVEREILPFGVPGAIETEELANLANSFLFSGRPDGSKMELQSFVSNFVGDGAIMTGDQQGSVLEVNIAGIDTKVDDSTQMLACCIGEKFTNMRQIIKRYTHTWTTRIGTTNAEAFYTINLPDKPPFKGWQGTASLNVDPLGILTTYARDSYLSYFSTAFLGYRGGFNHKYSVRTTTSGRNAITAARSNPGYLNGIIGLTTATTSSAYASDILQYPDTRSGALHHDMASSNCIEFNTPYNSTAKFLWSQDRTPQVVKSTQDRGYDTAWHNVTVQYSGAANIPIRVDRYVAASDDFTFYMFLYPPRMTTDTPQRYT